MAHCGCHGGTACGDCGRPLRWKGHRLSCWTDGHSDHARESSRQRTSRLRAAAAWRAEQREIAAEGGLRRLPAAEPMGNRHLHSVWTIAGRPGLYRYGRACQPWEAPTTAGRVVARHGERAAVFVRLVELEALIAEACRPLLRAVRADVG